MDPENDKHITTVFVGRDNEISVLNNYLEEARSGHSKLVFVTGEAGIGKTRLIREVGNHAKEMGAQFITGRCISHQHGDPYLPFIDALGIKLGSKSSNDSNSFSNLPIGMSGVGDDSSYEDDGDLPLGLLPMAGGHDTNIADMDMAGQRDRMFNTIADLIKTRATKDPLFIFLDDMQYADGATLQLLFYIARSLQNSKVMICCAYRPNELDMPQGQVHPLTQMLRRMGQEKLYSSLQLNPLSLDEIREKVESILEITDIPSGFMNKLYDESEGNPFFVEEVLKSLMDEGVIKRHSHIWDAGLDLSSIRIPNTIKDVITHRIAKMNESSKKVLKYASVIGQKFQFDVLQKVSEMNSEELLDTLDHLIDIEMIHEDSGSHHEEAFYFGHKQTRTVIYEGMSRSRIRVMHLKVGNIIEEMYKGRLNDVIFALARHFTLGKDFTRSHEYSKQAGTAAMASFAFEDAIEHFTTALRALSFLGDDCGIDIKKEGLDLSFQLGDLDYAMGDPAAAVEHYRNALQNSQALGDKESEAEAYLYIGHTERLRGNFHRAEDMYEKAIVHFDSTDNYAGLAGSQQGLGYVHWRKGENDEAVEHYKESISFSMKAGDDHGMAKTHIELGNVYNYWGDYAKAMQYYKKSIPHLEKVGDYNELARAYNNMGDSTIKVDDFHGALEYFEKCKQASEKIGNKNFVAWSLFNSAEALAYLGEYDKAEDYCVRALKICEDLDDRVGMNGVFKNFGVIYRFKKEWDKSIENFNKSIVILEMLDIPYELGVTYSDLAKTYEDMGEIEEALENFNMAKDLLESVGSMSEAKEIEDKIKELEG